jgi:hypothetical protein
MSVYSSFEVDRMISMAVSHYWNTRLQQKKKQELSGRSDQGARGAVTGGAQMDRFIDLFTTAIKNAGIGEECIFRNRALELPGYFRPTKEWDLLVISNNVLVAVIEAKSQVGPSFGNNFNNRTEEAIGSAIDLWTAFREGVFNQAIQPFLGYLFMLEDAKGSRMPVKVREPHFKVLPEFVEASYAKRYELLCRKLILERHYTASAFLTSARDTGLKGIYNEPAKDLTISSFIQSLQGSVSAHAQA